MCFTTTSSIFFPALKHLRIVHRSSLNKAEKKSSDYISSFCNRDDHDDVNVNSGKYSLTQTRLSIHRNIEVTELTYNQRRDLGLLQHPRWSSL